MFHIFVVDGLITEEGKPVNAISGTYVASASTQERARRYIYSPACGEALQKLGVSRNASLVIIGESDIYARIAIRQAKQVFTIEELRKRRKWK